MVGMDTAALRRTIAEAFAKSGCEIVEVTSRFLPCATKSAILKHPFLVRLYLWFRPARRLCVKQFLIVCRKPLGCPAQFAGAVRASRKRL
jgi:hypothetical protein